MPFLSTQIYVFTSFPCWNQQNLGSETVAPENLDVLIWFDHILALESEPSPFASGLNLSLLQNVNEGETYPQGLL